MLSQPSALLAHDPAVAVPDWRLCTAITREHGRTFYLASHFQTPDRRRALHAIYAFCRIADDIVDRAATPGQAEALLAQWEAELDTPQHPVAIAFARSRRHYGIPVAPARDLLTGIRSDLRPAPFATWEDLRVYCYLVAGTVGLLTAPILGCSDDAALPCAVELGIAMQLTNILRDVGEDARQGRLYLPLSDLAAFGCCPEAVLAGRPGRGFRELIAFEIARARTLYAAAQPGIAALSPAGQMTTLAASRFYASILTRIEELDYDVFSSRATVQTRRKLGALPAVALDFARLSWAPFGLPGGAP
ncbi:MAG: phytoene/squalene synthase family protein [Thermomicrobiales bacterium]